MSELNRALLKAFFETGDIPTEAQFADFIDSCVNITDDLGGSPADVRSIKVAISSAQILALFATPIQIIPAPPAGEYIDIISANANLVFNTTAYATTNAIQLQNPSAATTIYNLSQFLNASANLNRPFFRPTPFAVDQTQLIVAEKIEVAAPVGNPTLGDSPMDVYCAYRIVTL